MKKLTITILLIITGMSVAGCSMMGRTKPPSLLGKWSGTIQNGMDVTITFNEDMTATITLSGDQQMDIEAKYKVDYSTTPVSIDIYDMTTPQGSGASLTGIIEFRESTTMVMQGNFSMTGKAERPTSFTGEAVTYTRVAQ